MLFSAGMEIWFIDLILWWLSTSNCWSWPLIGIVSGIGTDSFPVSESACLVFIIPSSRTKTGCSGVTLMLLPFFKDMLTKIFSAICLDTLSIFVLNTLFQSVVKISYGRFFAGSIRQPFPRIIFSGYFLKRDSTNSPILTSSPSASIITVSWWKHCCSSASCMAEVSSFVILSSSSIQLCIIMLLARKLFVPSIVKS